MGTPRDWQFVLIIVHPHSLLVAAQLRNVFASAQSVRGYGRRWRRGNRKLVTYFNHNACSDAQSSGRAAFGHPWTRRRSTTNGYDNFRAPPHPRQNDLSTQSQSPFAPTPAKTPPSG